MRRLVLIASLLVACRKAPPKPKAVEHATLAITNVRVFDGERVVARADVLVDGERIVAVGPGLAIPAGVEVVDGANRTLLPGLIDAHTHVYDGTHLEQALAFGVTTELDMFSLPAWVKPLRESRPDRADLRSAGILATAPGGHGTEYGFEIPTITDPAEAQAFADARFAEGSDYLKIVHDGGAAYGLTIPTVSAPVLRALVEAAHARGKLAVVHIGTYAEARTAIESGADGLVHLFRDAMPGADFGTLVAGKRAFVTPTLVVLRTLQGGTSPILEDAAMTPYLGHDARDSLAASFRFRAKAPPEVIPAAIAQLRDAHVPILCGTDAPNPGTAHGASMHDELALLVGAGLPPATALAGATALPARIFGLADRGRIAVGLRADLVLVDGDPTTTIADSRRIVAVWRGGAKLDRAAFAARVAEVNQAAAAAAAAPIGPISDFEDGTVKTRFGQAWTTSTDEMIGGKSTATVSVVPGGTGTGTQAMAIEGEVVGAGDSVWAGAIFMPGARPFAPVDLSSKPRLTFVAQGDGTHLVMVFSNKRGRAPAVQSFRAGPTPAPVSFAWKDFQGIDGTDVTAIFIGHAAAGRFRIVVDDVAVQ